MHKLARLLYHYAAEPYDELRTRRAQGVLTSAQVSAGQRHAEFRKDPAPYYDHISFFSRPLPLATIGALYQGKGNALWNPGQVLYEHVVDSRDLGDVPFKVVETPADVAELDKWPGDDADPDAKRRFFARRALRKLRSGETGDTQQVLDKALGRIGSLADAYRSATSSFSSAEDWKRYATAVPHVQVYPRDGAVHLARPPRRVVVGGGDPAQ
jgi:hypothetical protein